MGGRRIQYLLFAIRASEDKLFGDGVTIQVALTWTGTTLNLYLNGSLVQSSAYKLPVPNWTSASDFDLGGYEYSKPPAATTAATISSQVLRSGR